MPLADWQTVLVCPIDHQPLRAEAERYVCPDCQFVADPITVKDRVVFDFRAATIPQFVTVTFQLPMQPLDRYRLVQTHFRAPNQTFAHFSDTEVKRQFGTKIDKGIQFYCQQLLANYGSEARLLDLGCGNGGNQRYLRAIGFKNVLSVDWQSAGADLLVDAHRLPFAAGTFQAVISTAVFEHLYNPFVAMSEIGRVLTPTGAFVGSASFWEAWHGSSYFHLTPDGWNALCQPAGLQLDDLWSGWGIVPAALVHVLTPGHFRRFGYWAQRRIEDVYRLRLGEMGVRRLQLRASGSYYVYLRKRGQ